MRKFMKPKAVPKVRWGTISVTKAYIGGKNPQRKKLEKRIETATANAENWRLMAVPRNVIKAKEIIR